MGASRSGGGPGDRDTGTWTNESLPLHVRKQLLERDLNRLGFRKAGPRGASTPHDGSAGQQQGGGGASHPQAGDPESSGHAD